MKKSLDNSGSFQRSNRSNSLTQDSLNYPSVSDGGFGSLYSSVDTASANLYCSSPNKVSPSCKHNVFTFDGVQNGCDFDNQNSFRNSGDLFQSGPRTDMGGFSHFSPNYRSGLEEDNSYPVDPYYLPSFRKNDSLLMRDQGMSPTLQKRSFRSSYSSLPNLSNCHDASVFRDGTAPATPTLFSPSFANHGLPSPYSRQPSASEPFLFSEHSMGFPIANSPPKKTSSFSAQTTPNKTMHNSPQRTKRLGNSRGRGGSPSSPDPSNELRIEDVISGKDKRTTLMIKNIPNAFSREVVLSIVDQYCKNEYDFFYLPIDQKTNCNLGYGYINMLSTESIVKLYNELNNQKWQNTRSVKVCSICYGRLQSGTENLVQYCSDWSVMTSDEKYHPLFFREVVRIVDGKEVRSMERYNPEINLAMKNSS